MKVLLVALNAKYIHSNLAVYSLIAYANQYKENLGLVEMTINHSEETILKAIYKEKADVVAFSCYIWNIGMVNRVSAQLKKLQPGVKLWYGGPEVSYDAPEYLKKFPFLDGVMIGEGEQTFLELLEYYLKGNRELSDIAGLCYRFEGKQVITGDRLPLTLDSIPFPYENMEVFRNRIIYYESSRGCPFTCSYCLSSIDKRVRFRDISLVKRELQIFLDYQVPQVKFVDRTFNCNKKHAMGIWNFIKEHDNGITNFHFELSAELLEEDELELLSTLRPGQVQLEIGVQTTNQNTAKAIHRVMDFEKLARNVLRIKAGQNIHQHLDLIAGLPLESFASFEKSFQDVYRLKPDQLQLGFLKVLKGSSMETDSTGYGITFRDNAPYEVLFTEALTYDEVLKLKGICEMVEIYYNSGQFTCSIRYLEHFYASPMRLYQEISEFYERKGYDSISHSRVRRYEILLEFFEEKAEGGPGKEENKIKIELFKELLVMDIFLREDIKTRPAFAADRKDKASLQKLQEKYRDGRRTTHIEPFEFDVLRSSETGEAIRTPVIIVFDYAHRDPLNKGAGLTILEGRNPIG